MISNKRKRKNDILGASTKLHGRVALPSQRTRSRKRFPDQPDLETLRSMIAEGKLGIYKLGSQPRSDLSLEPRYPSPYPVLLQVLRQDVDSGIGEDT